MNATAETNPRSVIAFWRDAGAGKWFNGGAEFDAACRERFLGAHFAAARREFAGWMDDAEGALARFVDAHHAAARRELDGWLASADGTLALVLLLDQIPRNVFRGSAHAFATDGLAREIARNALDAGFDMRIDVPMRIFFYMPFEHSEEMPDQDRAVALCTAIAMSSRASGGFRTAMPRSGAPARRRNRRGWRRVAGSSFSFSPHAGRRCRRRMRGARYANC